ncbi:MAG: hypothetical protein AAF557_09785 [Pseudomonadota bacterium]
MSYLKSNAQAASLCFCAGIIGVAFSLGGSSPAKAEFKHCYWNSPDLPHSIVPRPDVKAAKYDNAPSQITLGLLLTAPDLWARSLCGAVREQDIQFARTYYENQNCTPESLIGQMVESLGDGGRYIYPGWLGFEYFSQEFPQEMQKICDLISDIDAECFKGGRVETDEGIELYEKNRPQCAVHRESVNLFADLWTDAKNKVGSEKLESLIVEMDRIVKEAEIHE